MIESGMLEKRQGSDREEKVETQLNSHLLDTWTSTRSSILNVSSHLTLDNTSCSLFLEAQLYSAIPIARISTNLSFRQAFERGNLSATITKNLSLLYTARTRGLDETLCHQISTDVPGTS